MIQFWETIKFCYKNFNSARELIHNFVCIAFWTIIWTHKISMAVWKYKQHDSTQFYWVSTNISNCVWGWEWKHKQSLLPVLMEIIIWQKKLKCNHPMKMQHGLKRMNGMKLGKIMNAMLRHLAYECRSGLAKSTIFKSQASKVNE